MITHLHTRSNYSLLHSALKIEDIVRLAKFHQMDAIALCDEDVLYQAVEFYDLCIKNGIKPIIGLDKEIEGFSFLMIAKNNQGYLDLVSFSQNKITLEHNFENVFLILYPKEDKLKQALISHDKSLLVEYHNQLKHLKNLFIGISNTEYSIDLTYNQLFKKIFSLPPVALSYILYEKKEDDQILDVLYAIDLGYHLDDHRLPAFKGRHFRSIEEMKNLYSEEELENTQYIKNHCNINLEFKKNELPIFKQANPKQFLIQLCNKGLKRRRNNHVEEIYQKRLDYELDIIIKMGFENYFLVAWDVVLFAKKNHIYVGPGRGSSAGSLVAYCLGITKIDPILYNITFERFLNAERITMPDIDIDFPDIKRDLILDYVKEKYGESNVAHIITFATLKAKMCLRDVAKVLNIDSYELDYVLKFITNTNISLTQIISENEKLKEIISKNKKIKNLFSFALKIEDFPRHISTHASGVVISEHPIIMNCPTIEMEGQLTTQYTMQYLERFGLIKFDFLGLKNLSILENSVDLFKQISNKVIDLSKINLRDSKTYELLSRGNTLGIFQLESDGIKAVLQKIKPYQLEDIALVLALYRPGPMKNIPLFAQKREDNSQIQYPDIRLAPVLKETLGIMVYQEQIMQIAQIMANFTLQKADNLRRAMSKKDANEFKILKNEFVDNSVKNGFEKVKTENIFDQMLEFSNYGFNKAHAYSYALLSYQMAYLKANLPICFYTSLLNSSIGSSKTYQYLSEAKSIGLYIEKPNVNFSEEQYCIKNQKVYYPLTGVKNIGSKTAQIIEKYRGLFTSFVDFIVFALIYKIDFTQIENLIYAGALDDFKFNRTTLIKNLELVYLYCERILIKDINGEIKPNFNLLTPPKMIEYESNKMEETRKEKEVLGFYFSTHPFSEIRKDNPRYIQLSQIQINTKFQSLITIEKIKTHKTKKGDEMCFIVGSDEMMVFDFVVMPKIYSQYKNDLKVGDSYIIFAVKENEKAPMIQSFKKL